MSEECYCALVDAQGVVKNVIVCDDREWAQRELGASWVWCGGYLPAIGEPLPDPLPET